MKNYMKKYQEDNGYKRREISDTEIVDRCILALVNEGAKILQEGVSQRSGDMDVVYINGYEAFQFGEVDQCNTQIWKD